LVGVWYILAPFVWGYPMGFLWWHSIVIGAVVLAVSASYLVGWNRIGPWILIATGAYSMLSPFLHDYLIRQFAFWNDLFIGVVTIGLGAALGAATFEYRGEAEAPTG
ncbi:MAG: SPW repeat protein, partial [Gemmatimonadota bacterium]